MEITACAIPHTLRLVAVSPLLQVWQIVGEQRTEFVNLFNRSREILTILVTGKVVRRRITENKVLGNNV